MPAPADMAPMGAAGPPVEGGVATPGPANPAAPPAAPPAPGDAGAPPPPTRAAKPEPAEPAEPSTPPPLEAPPHADAQEEPQSEPEPAPGPMPPEPDPADEGDDAPPMHGQDGEPSPGPLVEGAEGRGAAEAGPGENVAGAPATAVARTPARSLARQQTRRPPVIYDPRTFIYRPDDRELFGARTPFFKTWDILKPTFVPLAGGTFIVDGIPITYALRGEAAAQSFAGITFGPGTLEEIRVWVTGPEADRLRLQRMAPMDPLLGPAALLISRPWVPPEGRFDADAMLRFKGYAAAGLSAQAQLEASLGVFGNLLKATAFAGVGGSAKADARTTVDTYITMSYDGGSLTFSTTLDLHAAFEMAFRLNAFAGVRVELGIPDIPVVTDLWREVASWPIAEWVVPDPSRFRWKAEYRKDWPLLNRKYQWETMQRFVIGGDGQARAEFPGAEGMSIDQVLRDAESEQRDGDLKDDPTGPGDERRNSDPAAISLSKAAALAQISSAKRSAEREKRANARLLTRARAATTGTAAASAGTPPPAVVGGGGSPVEQLEAREEKLDDALASTEELRERSDALEAPATAPDGTSRNEARAGFDAIATNADVLSDKIDSGEEGFAVPPSAEPDDPDYERMRTAMYRAYDAFDECFDPIRTEKLFADDQVRESGTDAELADYRNAAIAYQMQALELWRRVQKLETDLEKAREWYERHDHAAGVVVFGELETRGRDLKMEAGPLRAGRPVGDWDLDYVELSGGHLMLKPEYRGKATRSYFYPHDYSAATKTRMLAEIGRFRTGEDGLAYWEWRRKPSPRGDFWWKLDHPQEMPTLDHTNPTVLGHWNSVGRTGLYEPRRRFFDFVGEPLIVVPKSENSSAGGREPDSYRPQVTRTFRGAKR